MRDIRPFGLKLRARPLNVIAGRTQRNADIKSHIWRELPERFADRLAERPQRTRLFGRLRDDDIRRCALLYPLREKRLEQLLHRGGRAAFRFDQHMDRIRAAERNSRTDRRGRRIQIVLSHHFERRQARKIAARMLEQQRDLFERLDRVQRTAPGLRQRKEPQHGSVLGVNQQDWISTCSLAGKWNTSDGAQRQSMRQSVRSNGHTSR